MFEPYTKGVVWERADRCGPFGAFKSKENALGFMRDAQQFPEPLEVYEVVGRVSNERNYYGVTQAEGGHPVLGWTQSGWVPVL